ncbi:MULTISPECIES: DUF6440 family protein [Eubacterium]|uniref:DUF6440 domain-containing protein n=1 Tax=Eubacterium barkeri TaxID=1528 RepID=A0A1H3JGH0_EUBBA|nr:DUF6440 family protein [Eubacterium barkeri]SDY39002.1 hypothetical protein SAMN04488579_1304 [Eubacterium barkeri]
MSKKKKDKPRFEVVLHETSEDGSGSKIIEDRETGVVYLYHYGQGGAGMTALLDDQGDPAIGPER